VCACVCARVRVDFAPALVRQDPILCARAGFMQCVCARALLRVRVRVSPPIHPTVSHAPTHAIMEWQT
jgi:hypothetical protein